MKFRRLKAVARKEFLHILRDPRSLIMALALPAVMLLLFGWALTLDVDRIPLYVLDRDHSPQSRSLIALFDGSRYFDLIALSENYEQLEEAVDRGDCLAALVIPQDFSTRLEKGEGAQVQLLLDGTDSNTASIGQGYAQSILGDFERAVRSRALEEKMGRQLPPPVELRLRVWFNSRLESKNYIVPGLVAVILMIIAALLTSLTIAREWEMGTMEQLLSTPVRPSELVLGKMSAYFALGAVDTAMVVLIGVFLFEVPFRGDLILLAVSSFVFLFGALCWGILISASVRTQLLAYQLGMMTSFLPSFLLSGFVFAVEDMPVPVQVFTYIVPARYFITILRGIFLRGVGLSVLGVELILLTLFGLLVYGIATRKLRRKIA